MTISKNILHSWHLQAWPIPREQRDVVFVFGRAQGDWEHDIASKNDGVLWTAAQLVKQKTVAAISFPGTDGSYTSIEGPGSGDRIPTGYPGVERWTRGLGYLEVPKEAIVPTAAQGWHTRGEADAFTRLALQRGWETGYVVMNPHQVLRGMLSLLKSFAIYSCPLKILPVTPQQVDWNRKVYGSQGKEALPRYQHIACEFDRVERYLLAQDLVDLPAYREHLIDQGVPWGPAQ